MFGAFDQFFGLAGATQEAEAADATQLGVVGDFGHAGAQAKMLWRNQAGWAFDTRLEGAKHTGVLADRDPITLEGKRLEPIDFPTRKLNSEVHHQLRIAVDEVAASETHAMVTIRSAKDATAVALDSLFGRSVRLNIKGFDAVPNLADVLLSLRLARHEAEIIVSITRAIREGDKDLDLLVLKEFLGLKALAAEVPLHVQRAQKELWDGLG